MQLRHLGYLLVYIGAGAANSLLVKRSQTTALDGTRVYAYQPVAVTFCVTLSKLLLTAVYVFFVQTPNKSPAAIAHFLSTKLSALWYFLVPAALYFGFDTLAFFNLQLVQPATFRLLINIKVLFSGVLLYAIVGTQLSARQWLALFVLLAACVVEQLDSFDLHTGLRAILLICMQALCSSSAGVYFQYLLQSKRAGISSELGLWEKNLLMYVWSLAFNVLYLAVFAPDTLAHPVEATATFDVNVLPIILTSAVGGFCTSLILRDMSVIAKEYANFAEMCVVVVGGWLVLSAPIHANLVVAVLMVTYSLYLYNVQPSKAEAAASAVTRSGDDSGVESDSDAGVVQQRNGKVDPRELEESLGLIGREHSEPSDIEAVVKPVSISTPASNGKY